MIQKTVLTLTLVLLNCYSLFSQPQQNLYQQMIRAFQNLKFGTAEKFARQITADYESYTPSELLEAHKILGIIAYQRDMNLQQAKMQFEQALSIDQTTRLDSVNASVKTINFFNKLKTTFISKRMSGESEQAFHYRYLIRPDPRPAATLRSMVFPGWGQLYKNDRKKGYALIFSSAAVTISTVIFHVMKNNAHQDYLSATEPSLIKEKYDRYNRYYKLRNNTALLAGGIWLYAFFDALIAAPKQKQVKLTFIFTDAPRLWAQVSF